MVWVARNNASDGRVEADVDDDEDDDDFVKFGMDVILLAALMSSESKSSSLVRRVQSLAIKLH